MKSKIELNGNTYFIIGSKEEGYVVSKKHGAITKEVANPDRVSQVMALASEVVEPVVEAKVIVMEKQSKPSKKHK